MYGLFRVSWKTGARFSSHPIERRVGDALEMWRRVDDEHRNYALIATDPCGDWVQVQFVDVESSDCPCEELALHFAARGMRCEPITALGYPMPHAHHGPIVAYA